MSLCPISARVEARRLPLSSLPRQARRQLPCQFLDRLEHVTRRDRIATRALISEPGFDAFAGQRPQREPSARGSGQVSARFRRARNAAEAVTSRIVPLDSSDGCLKSRDPTQRCGGDSVIWQLCLLRRTLWRYPGQWTTLGKAVILCGTIQVMRVRRRRNAHCFSLDTKMCCAEPGTTESQTSGVRGYFVCDALARNSLGARMQEDRMRVELGWTMALVALVSSSCRPPTPAQQAPSTASASVALPSKATSTTTPPALPQSEFVPLTADASRKAELLALAPKLDALLAARVKETGTTGGAVGIALEGEVVYVRGFGVRDLESNQAVDGDTLFRIASITKTITSLAVLKLRDQGKGIAILRRSLVDRSKVHNRSEIVWVSGCPLFQ